QAGQLAARLSRVGGPQAPSTELLVATDPDQVLYQLGALTQLGDRWRGVLAEATTTSGTVASLTAQAQVARAEESRLADEAADRAADATAAQAAADAEVASATTQSDQLYAQLATLNDTSAEVERQYREGEAEKAAIAEQARAAAAAGAAARLRLRLLLLLLPPHRPLPPPPPPPPGARPLPRPAP
ncbi:hypothetical protein IFT72_06725, partial [Frigoribacterium sp. CFBP 8754]|nr:hypothetical protein [Frigoribacterium sp. CFBP 8754]